MLESARSAIVAAPRPRRIGSLSKPRGLLESPVPSVLWKRCRPWKPSALTSSPEPFSAMKESSWRESGPMGLSASPVPSRVIRRMDSGPMGLSASPVPSRSSSSAVISAALRDSDDRRSAAGTEVVERSKTT